MQRSDAFFILNDMYSEATAEQRAAINMAMKDLEFVDLMPKDMVAVVRCKYCKKRGKKKCPLVTVRFDVKTNGTIKEVLEQNYVDEDFWCKDGVRKDGE